MATIKGQRSALYWQKVPGGLPAIVDASKFSGNIFFVDSNAANAGDTAGHGSELDAPFATIDYAVGECVANQGDHIFVLPGHAESVIAAGTITLDVAGVTVVFLGHGAARGTMTFSTATSASVLITAANVKVVNALCVAGIDGLTNPFHVQAADCELDIEWRDGSATVEAARVVLTTAAADRLKVNLIHRGYTTGNAGVNAVRLVGCDGARIFVDYYGVCTTAIVEFHTTACTNVEVKGRFHVSGTSDLSKNVVDTVTGSTWSVVGFDTVAGYAFSGGDAAAVAGDDIGTVLAALYGTAGIGSFPAGAAAANNVSLAEVLRYAQENIIRGAGTVLPDAQSLYDLLAGANGIATWPAAAAPANAVSLAEALRYVVEQQLWRLATKAYTFAGQGGAQGPISLYSVTGDVEVEIFGIAKANFTSGGVATIAVGVSGNTTALIAQTTATELLQNEIWHDATPTTTLESISTVTSRRFVIPNGQDIILTIGTADLTAGDCTFYCRWRPLSSDGAVAAA